MQSLTQPTPWVALSALTVDSAYYTSMQSLTQPTPWVHSQLTQPTIQVRRVRLFESTHSWLKCTSVWKFFRMTWYTILYKIYSIELRITYFFTNSAHSFTAQSFMWVPKPLPTDLASRTEKVYLRPKKMSNSRDCPCTVTSQRTVVLHVCSIFKEFLW